MVAFEIAGYKVDFDIGAWFQENINYLLCVLIASYSVRFAYHMVNKMHREQHEDRMREEKLKAALGDVKDREEEDDGNENKGEEEKKKDK